MTASLVVQVAVALVVLVLAWWLMFDPVRVEHDTEDDDGPEEE